MGTFTTIVTRLLMSRLILRLLGLTKVEGESISGRLRSISMQIWRCEQIGLPSNAETDNSDKEVYSVSVAFVSD